MCEQQKQIVIFLLRAKKKCVSSSLSRIVNTGKMKEADGIPSRKIYCQKVSMRVRVREEPTTVRDCSQNVHRDFYTIFSYQTKNAINIFDRFRIYVFSGATKEKTKYTQVHFIIRLKFPFQLLSSDLGLSVEIAFETDKLISARYVGGI